MGRSAPGIMREEKERGRTRGRQKCLKIFSNYLPPWREEIAKHFLKIMWRMCRNARWQNPNSTFFCSRTGKEQPRPAKKDLSGGRRIEKGEEVEATVHVE